MQPLTGRGRVFLVPSPLHDGRWVVRHYHRGGAVAPLLGDRYLRLGPWYRGDLVTRYVPGSRDLAAVLFPGRAAEEVDPATAMEVTGQLFRTLHEGGVIHPDLNLKNILIVGAGPSPGARVLDLDGARLRSRVGARARRRMVERFWRSGRKWSARTGKTLDPVWVEAFNTGYDRG
jgi:3-deoxy-D-manno-octulosonic acid kinase